MLISGARVWPPDAHLTAEAALAGLPRSDVRLTGGLITERDPVLRPEPGEEVIDANGGGLLPGPPDHPAHLRARAAPAASGRARAPRGRAAPPPAPQPRPAAPGQPPGPLAAA